MQRIHKGMAEEVLAKIEQLGEDVDELRDEIQG